MNTQTRFKNNEPKFSGIYEPYRFFFFLIPGHSFFTDDSYKLKFLNIIKYRARPVYHERKTIIVGVKSWIMRLNLKSGRLWSDSKNI